MPEGRDLAEAMAARDRDYGSAASADIDVGMGGGGFTPVGDPRDFRAGPDVPDMPSPDIIAAIAAQLESGADAGAVPNAVAVNQQGDKLSNAQVQALINLQNQYSTTDVLGNTTSVPDTWSNPGVSQNYSDFGMAGQDPRLGQSLVSGGLNYANAMEVDTRRQELMAELDRLNAESVRASDATQPYPSSWSQPDEWGMEAYNPGSVGPQWDQDALGQQGMPDPNARRNFEIQNPSPLESSRPGPIASHFPSPLESSRPGPTQRELDTHYPSPLESSIPWSPEYDDEWGMQDVGLSPIPSLYPDQKGITQPIQPSIDQLSGGELDRSTNQTADAVLEEQAWRTVNDPEVQDYIEGKITAEKLSKINSVVDLEKVVKKDIVEKSKRLTKEEKIANVAARRKAEQSYVDFRDTLNFQVEMLRSRLATAINTHGKNSKEAKNVKRDVKNKEADLRMWERSDIYNKSYGMVNRPGLSNIGPMKALTGIENYFHSLGKTERRSPEDLLQDMKDNPEKYERVGAEVSAAQLVRNMYSFLRKASIDVAAAAAREPAYLRYLINLNVNKQPIPTSYSSNWKNDISDAWIYG